MSPSMTRSSVAVYGAHLASLLSAACSPVGSRLATEFLESGCDPEYIKHDRAS